MFCYAYGIKYFGKTNIDYNTIVQVSFDGSNSQDSTFLDLDPVYTDSRNSSFRIDSGAKYSSTAEFDVTFIKKEQDDFSKNEIKDILKWLARKQNSWLELYNEYDELECMYLGRWTKISQQRLDARTVGLIATFTSVSPFAFSDVIEDTYTINNTNKTITIDNTSDDLDSYLYPKIIIQSLSKIDALTVENETVQESLVIKNIGQREIISIDNFNKIIYSDNKIRVIGTDFTGIVNGVNTVYPAWFKLAPSENKINFSFSENANITFTISYRVPIKVGAY